MLYVERQLIHSYVDHSPVYPEIISNVFWVYRTANLETWANHGHCANFQ